MENKIQEGELPASEFRKIEAKLKEANARIAELEKQIKSDAEFMIN